MSAVLKIVMAAIIVVAAASGTDVVDVVEVMGDVTEQAQDFAGDVEVEGDETALFDKRVDEEGVEVTAGDPQVFARSSDKTGVRTASEALAYSQPSSKGIGSYTKTVPAVVAIEDSSVEPSTNEPAPTSGPASTSKPSTPSQSPAPTTTAAPGTTATPTSESPTTTTAPTTSESTTTTAGPTTTESTTTTAVPSTTTTAAPTTTTTAAPTTTTAAPTTTTTAAPTTTTTVAGG